MLHEQKVIDALAEWLHNRDHAYDAKETWRTTDESTKQFYRVDAKHALQFMDSA
jgi:hypothetical protein